MALSFDSLITLNVILTSVVRSSTVSYNQSIRANSVGVFSRDDDLYISRRVP